MEANIGKPYTTHLVGIISSILQCTHIVVYNQKEYLIEKESKRLTIYSLDEIYEDLMSGGFPCVELYRQDFDENTPYYYTPGSLSNFNVIIYVDSTGKPLGYTEFSNFQGGSKLEIYTSFDSSITGEASLVIKIKNSLSGVRGKRNTTALGDNLWEYSSSKKVSEYVESLPLREYYSDSLGTLGDGSLVYNPGTGSYDVSGLYCLDFLKDKEFNYLGYDGWKHWQLGLHNANFVIYMWDETYTRYFISCISKSGNFSHFNRPLMLVDTEGKKYATLPSYSSSLSVQKIEYGAGKYLVCTLSDDSMAIYDTQLKDWIRRSRSGYVINPFDPTAKIYECFETREYSKVTSMLERYPFLSGLSYDFTKEENKYGYQIKRLVGSWVLFCRLRGDESVWFVSSPNLTVMIDSSEIDKVRFINDSAIMIDDGETYTLFQGSRGELLQTEKCIDLSLVNNNQDKVKVINKKSYVYKTPLNNYRRNYIPKYTSGKVPEIFDSFGGFLFYMDSDHNKINFL